MVSEQNARIVQRYGGSYDDPRLSGWLAGVAARLTAHVGRPDLRVTVVILDTAEINAFSTEGGAIFVTRGLLNQAANEAEVAAALAHEIGHLLRGDQRQRFERSVERGAGAVLASLFVGPGGLAHDESKESLGYTAEQELGADDRAIHLLADAGYDPRALTNLLSAIRQDSPEPRAGWVDVDEHPMTEQRIARAHALIRSLPDTSRQLGRDSYLRVIDGSVYGGGTAGYLRGGYILLPRTGTKIPAPDVPEPRVSDGALVARSNDGSWLVLSRAHPGPAVSPIDYLSRDWGRGLTLQPIEPASAGQFTAAVGRTEVQTEAGRYALVMAAVGWSPTLVYRIAAFAPEAAGTALDHRVRRMLAGFGRMSAMDERTLGPLRLHVVTVRSGDTVARLSRRMATGLNREMMFRALNRLGPRDSVRPGQQVKIVS